MSAAEHLLNLIVSTGLPGRETPILERPLERREWAHLLAAVARARVTGHLTRAIDSGALAVTTAQRCEAIEMMAAAFGVDLALEAALLETVDTLETAAVDVRVLKGPALAHLSYADPADRSFGDVDILVRGSQYDDAIAALERSGARRRFPEPRAGFDRRFGKGVCMVRPDGLEIDVHRTFAAGCFGLAIELDDVWSGAAHFRIGEKELLALDRECRFLHACYHAALGDPTPRWPALRDVAQMLTFDAPATSRTLELAMRWRGGAVVARAVALAVELLDWTPDHVLVDELARYSATSWETRALHGYSSQGSYAMRAASGVRVLRRPSDRVAYTLSLVIPTRSYLAERDGTYVGRARRAVDAFRSRSKADS